MSLLTRILRNRLVWLAALLVAFAAFAAIDRRIGLQDVNGQDPEVARWADEPLTSICIRGDDVFAFNRWGLFRASREEQHWTSLNLPLTLPLTGRFLQQASPSGRLYYYVAGGVLRTDKRLGLYASDDRGSTWHQASSRTDLGRLNISRNGHLFTLANIPAGARGNGSAYEALEESSDGGRSWATIYSRAPVAQSYSRILEDPENPDLVCLQIVTTVPQYEVEILRWDAGRSKWMSTDLNAWNNLRPEPVFEPTDGGGASYQRAADVRATLANYFAHDFGEKTYHTCFAMSTDSKRYVFHLEDAKWVDVTFAPTLPSGAGVLYDDVKSEYFFAARGIRPDGRTFRGIGHGLIAAVGPHEKIAAAPYLSDDPKPHQISSTQPYRRKVDLENLLQSRIPGEYQIQLLFNCETPKLPPMAASMEGHLVSPVFTVIVLPPKSKL